MVRFREHGKRPVQLMPAEVVHVTCDRCPWVKDVDATKVVASLRGHYGYMHPERRMPDPSECLARIRPST